MSPRAFKRCLITGINGSGASYLAEYIAEHHPDIKIFGLSRWHSTSVMNNMEDIKKKITIYESDLNDLSSLIRTLQVAQPDVIFHFAAHANVRVSFQTPLSVMQNNIMGTANLYEAVRIAGQDPVIQVCSTSEVYGQVNPENVPITEECPIRPANPYAVSKVTGDLLGFVYWKSYQMKIIRTRMFAYINPRREDLFATSFTKQIAYIEAGLQKELLHGNLESTRTLIDVRDAMAAYWVAVEKCELGEVYNIGGRTVITVGKFLDTLKKIAKVEIPSRVDPALLRPTDVTLQIPDTSKFETATGWKPQYSFEESLEYLLAYWRERVAQTIK